MTHKVTLFDKAYEYFQQLPDLNETEIRFDPNFDYSNEFKVDYTQGDLIKILDTYRLDNVDPDSDTIIGSSNFYLIEYGEKVYIVDVEFSSWGSPEIFAKEVYEANFKHKNGYTTVYWNPGEEPKRRYWRDLVE